MTGYKESLDIMKNLSASVEQAIKVEAAFKTPEQVAKEKKERAEAAKKRNEETGKGETASKEFVRNSAAIAKEMEEISSKIAKLQMQLSHLENPTTSKDLLDKEIDHLTDVVEKYKTQLETLEEDKEIQDNFDKEPEVQERLNSKIKEVQNAQASEKVARLHKEKEIREKIKQTSDKTEQDKLDEESKSIRKSRDPSVVQLENEEKDIRKELEQIQSKLHIIRITRAFLKNAQDRLNHARQSAKFVEDNPTDTKQVEEIKKEIESLKSRKAELSLEAEGKQVPYAAVAKYDIERGLSNISGEDDLTINQFMEALSTSSDIDEMGQEITKEGPALVVNDNILDAKYNVQDELTSLDRKISMALDEFSTNGTKTKIGYSATQQKIQDAIGNIDLYDDKIMELSEILKTSTDKSETNKLQESIKKLQIAKRKEEMELETQAKSIPGLEALIKKKKSIKNQMYYVDKAAIQNKELMYELRNSNYRTATTLLEQFYKNNIGFYCSVIAKHITQYIQYEWMSNDETIGRFVIAPDAEQINLEHPGVLTPKELDNLSGMLSINTNKVKNEVNRIYRSDPNLHNEIIYAYAIQLSDSQLEDNPRLAKLAAEDIFANIFFNYKKFSKNDLQVQPSIEVGTPAQIIVQAVTNNLIGILKSYISDAKGRLSHYLDMLAAESKKDTPIVAENKRAAITEEREIVLNKIRADVAAMNIPEEEKQQVLTEKLDKATRLYNSELSKIEEQDPERVKELRAEIQNLQGKYKELSGDNLTQPQQTSVPVEPTTIDLITAAGSAFEYLGKNPGISSVNEEGPFVKLLDVSKAIMRFVNATSATAGPIWMKVRMWRPNSTSSGAILFPFIARKSGKETHYDPIGIMFRMELDKTDYQKGKLFVSLVNSSNYEDYSYGEIVISNKLDNNSGRVYSEIESITPVTNIAADGNSVIPNRTKSANRMRGLATLNSAINQVHKQYGGFVVISRQKLLANPDAKQEIIDIAAEDIAARWAAIMESKNIKEKIDIEAAKKAMEQLYEAVVSSNNKTARTKKLIGLQKFAMIASQ